MSRLPYYPQNEENREIEFKNINFKYPDSSKRIFNDFNLVIKTNDVIGIIGENGSGKSTLIKLLTQIYKPNSGEILLNGIDINQYNIEYLRKEIGLVNQSNFLLSGTIKDICSLSGMEIEDEKIKKMMKMFCLNSDNFRNGVLTNISENNMNISGGELQRLNLIRVFLENKSIYLFDEPTASIDVVSENIICNNMKKLLKNKTAIIITHRPKLLELCNHVIVIQNGKPYEKK